MKALHHEYGFRERVLRPFARLAVAGTIMLGGCATTTQNMPEQKTVMGLAVPKGCDQLNYSSCSKGHMHLNGSVNEVVDAYGVKARVVYPSAKSYARMVAEYRQDLPVKEEVRNGDFVFASRINGVPDEGNAPDFTVDFIYVIALGSPKVESLFFVSFDGKLDKSPTEPKQPGNRIFEVGRFPEPVFSQMSDVVVVVDAVGGPPSLTAHALPRAADGHILGSTPQGQLAYSITFYPMTKVAEGGWTVLRDWDWSAGKPRPPLVAAPSTLRQPLLFFEKISRERPVSLIGGARENE